MAQTKKETGGKLDVKQLLARRAAAWVIKDKWRVIYEEAYELVMPGLNPYASDKNAPKPMNRQFDSTAVKSATRLANRLLTELTPPDQNWLELKTGPALDLQLGEDKAAAEQINRQLSGISTLANMVVNQGEMVDARGAALLDLVIAGTGVLLDLEDMGSDTNPMISQCVSQAEIAVVTDARGRDVEFYRNRDGMKIRDIEGLWPDATMTQELTDLLGKAKDGEDPEVQLAEVTYWGGVKDPRWYYEILHITGKGKTADKIVERVYDICPWTILRWLRLPGVPYGPGPVLISMADIRTANKIVEMVLKNASIALAGMYLVRDDGVLNPDNIMIAPGALIPVAATGGSVGASMVPLDAPRSFDISQLVLENFQKRIRAGLYDDSLPEVSGNPRSATEIINRVRELTQDIGGAIGRLTSDTVQYGRKVVDILVRQGFIPYRVEIDQFTLKMQINSPLANAQQMREVQTVIQWLETVIGLGGPQLATVVARLPEIAVWAADRMGVPAILIPTAEERQKAQQEMAQLAAAQAQQQAGGAPMQQAA